MVASARSAATTGSHQVAAPIAMRMGIARGAVIGNHETSCAQRVSALPIAAKDTRKPTTRMTDTGPVRVEASSVRDASDPSVPNTVA